MKALTIRQPWASLIALGVKHIETRSWRAPQSLIGQTIAIHAGKHQPVSLYPLCSDLLADGRWMLKRFGEGGRYTMNEEMALGAIVATATLADCLPMVDRCSDTLAHICHSVGAGGLLRHSALTTPVDGETEWVISDQLPYGDFAPGRWAWMLTNVQPCEPIPAKGKQGLWTVRP